MILPDNLIYLFIFMVGLVTILFIMVAVMSAMLFAVLEKVFSFFRWNKALLAFLHSKQPEPSWRKKPVFEENYHDNP